MTQPIPLEKVRLAARQRGLLVGSGALLLILLGTAARLQPSPLGLGTHQQLGLPPCSIRLTWGFRCPACGMTTSWAHLVRGNLVGALRANVGGTLLAVAAALVGPWSLISGLRGKWLTRPPSDWLSIGVAGGLMAVTFVDWVCRLSIR